MIERKTLNAKYLQTLSWLDGGLVDWANGSRYFLNDESKSSTHFSAFKWDSSTASSDGKYAFIYQKLGTKGAILKDGKIIREVNRSSYFADTYEYPAAIFKAKNGRTYLIHCPVEYNRLEIEDIETGEIVTNVPERKPADFFHSRLEVNQANSHFLSKGWVWHPVDFIGSFDVEACIKNPLLLDNGGLSPVELRMEMEIGTASFIDNGHILFGTKELLADETLDEEETFAVPPGHIAVWDIEANTISKPVKVDGKFGNLYAIDESFTWDTFGHPKIINIKTGKIEEEIKDITSGEQDSSIRPKSDDPIKTFDSSTKQLAFGMGDKIEVLTWRTV